MPTTEQQERRLPLRIAITGSGGMVGSELLSYGKKRGDTMVPLVRQAREAENEVLWDPQQGRLNPEDLEGCDVLIHLAGENIAARRWTAAQKKKIQASRQQGTSLLARTLAQLKRPPSVWLSASAIGYYGTREPPETCTETSAPGDDFLAQVTRAWEEATRPAVETGIRVVHLRFGVILSTKGGALRKMLPLFRCGLGGRMGSGQQIMNWWPLSDMANVVEFLLQQQDIHGPVNIVSPHACPQFVFAKALASALHRPAVVPTPAFAMRLALGEMAEALLLKGGTVLPTVLQNHHYPFPFADLPQTLDHLLTHKL